MQRMRQKGPAFEWQQCRLREWRRSVEAGSANFSAVCAGGVYDPGHLSFNCHLRYAVGIREKPFDGKTGPHGMAVVGRIGRVLLGVDVIEAPDFGLSRIRRRGSTQSRIISKIQTKEVSQGSSCAGVDQINGIP